MNSYMVLKMTGKGSGSGRSAIVLPLDTKGKRSFRVVGNIPELYYGMTIELDLSGDKVTDYSLTLDEKNIQSLTKAKIDISEYYEILKKHLILKNDGVGWNTIKKAGDSALYSNLPFDEADQIHKKTINQADDNIRLDALETEIISIGRQKRKISYSINEYLNFFEETEKKGAYAPFTLTEKISFLQRSHRLNMCNCAIWDTEMKQKEQFVRADIQERKDKNIEFFKKENIDSFIRDILKNNLEEEQKMTLYSLCSSAPCIITGGAGTGKTTVIKTIAACFSRYNAPNSVLLVAPTGKASRQLAEKTGFPASTIHRALRKTPEDDFIYYNADNPLSYKLVIVDESSMIDTALMYDLLNAVQSKSKIIFVGDHNQLYPVNYGEPFFDFEKLIDVYELKINHRQSKETDILSNANNVLANKPLYNGNGVNIKEISASQIKDIVAQIDDTAQIISPYNAVNAQINDLLKKGDKLFNVGDKVITTRNTKEYCNGDIGVVTKTYSNGNIAIDIEGKIITIDSKDLKDVMLAYAITIHKMQGSEADNIVAFFPKNNFQLSSRMLYTAITRAKKHLQIYYYDEGKQ